MYWQASLGGTGQYYNTHTFRVTCSTTVATHTDTWHIDPRTVQAAIEALTRVPACMHATENSCISLLERSNGRDSVDNLECETMRHMLPVASIRVESYRCGNVCRRSGLFVFEA